MLNLWKWFKHTVQKSCVFFATWTFLPSVENTNINYLVWDVLFKSTMTPDHKYRTQKLILLINGAHSCRFTLLYLFIWYLVHSEFKSEFGGLVPVTVIKTSPAIENQRVLLHWNIILLIFHHNLSHHVHEVNKISCRTGRILGRLNSSWALSCT